MAVIIDLTSSSVDPRVKYTGPAHTYLNSSGLIVTSAENEWPLEYVNGVAIGRHEPEPAAVNYVPGVEYSKISRGGTTDDWNYGSTATPVIAPSDFGLATATTTTGSVLTAVYSEATSSFIAAAQDGGSPSAWTRVTRKFTNASTALLRWYVARTDANDYLLARCGGVPAGQYIASVYRKVTSGGLLSAAAQLEAGSLATSPIISAAGMQGTRSASSVTVNTNNISSLKVVYSDGTSDTYQTTGNSFSLPTASKNWAERYIQRIELTEVVMPITSMQTITAGSLPDLVAEIKRHIAASRFPQGGIKGVKGTGGGKTQYFQQVAAGGTAATDYDVVYSSDRAEFTKKVNAKITAGFLPIGDMSVQQLTPGRTCEFAQAFTKA